MHWRAPVLWGTLSLAHVVNGEMHLGKRPCQAQEYDLEPMGFFIVRVGTAAGPAHGSECFLESWYHAQFSFYPSRAAALALA